MLDMVKKKKQIRDTVSVKGAGHETVRIFKKPSVCMAAAHIADLRLNSTAQKGCKGRNITDHQIANNNDITI
jgi:hypothetical protein